MSESIRATHLDDLGIAPVVVTLHRPDGQAVEVVMRPLSEGEMWELRRGITWPKPPVKDLQRVNGQVVEIYDYESDGYLGEQAEANRLLNQRALLVGLQLEIPGGTEDEKIVALRARLGSYAYRALLEASQRMNIVGGEELAAVVASFRPSGNGSAPRDGAPSVHPLAMAPPPA